MKVMNRALIIAVFGTAITFHADSFAKPTKKAAVAQVTPSESVVESSKSAEATVAIEREKIEEAIVDTETIKTAATLAINKAREQLAKGEISAVEAAKIIGEQDYRIEQANKLLAMEARRAVDSVEQAEVEEGYTSQLISGARGLGERVLAPFKSGYGYTEEEKAIARSIIAQLEKQLEEIIKSYEFKVTATDLKVLNRSVQELDTIKQEFAKAIHEQQLITGDVMSTNRKLFWGAVGLAGAAIGTALAQQYLNMELPTGEILQKETSQEKSLIEQGLEKLNRTEQRFVPEEQPFGGVSLYEGPQVGEKSLLEQGLEKLGKTEQRFAPEEEAFGGVSLYEGPGSGEKSLSEQALERLDKVQQLRATEEQPGENIIVGEQEISPLREKLENLPTETQEEYRARIQKAQESFGRPAVAQVELRQQPQVRRSAAEQEALLSEIGQDLSERGKSVIEASKSVLIAPFGVEQYRTPEEATGDVTITLTPEQIEKGVQFGEKALERIRTEESLGRRELYEGAEPGEESIAEKATKAFKAGATAPIDPESGI